MTVRRGMGGVDRSVLLGAVGVVLAVVGTLGVTTGTFSEWLRHEATRPVNAEFATTQQLRVGDTVRIAGVDAGAVRAIERGAQGRTRVTMDLRRSAGPLYADARAGIRLRTVLAGSNYVAIERGTPSAGELGARAIPRSRTSSQVEIDDVASIVQRDAERGLKRIPRTLARALRDPGAPTEAIDALADEAAALRRGLRSVRGTVPSSDIATLVDASAATVKALDTPADDARSVVEGAAATLSTTAAHAAELRRTLALAPGTLRRVDRTLTRLDRTLALANPLLRRLEEPVGELAPTARALRPTLVDADRLLADARPLAAQLPVAASDLAQASRVGAPLLRELAPGLEKLDTVVLPGMGEMDAATGHTPSQMVGPTFGGLGGAAGGVDNNGRYLRFAVAVGSGNLALPCNVLINTELIRCNSLNDTLQALLKAQPFGELPGAAPRGKAKR
ncbi:MAG: MlaD family protein [Solirubrobacteraceae bacterium]